MMRGEDWVRGKGHHRGQNAGSTRKAVGRVGEDVFEGKVEDACKGKNARGRVSTEENGRN